jgi:hypothetical protein
MSFKKRCTIGSSYEFQAHQQCSQRRCCFPRMLYCDSRCSQMLSGLSPALPGALICNLMRVIFRQRVRGSVRAVRAVRNTWVFQTETRVVADAPYWPLDHAINLQPGFNSPYSQISDFLEVVLKSLQVYIETHLANGFIRR